jgi:hypothetical protein
MLLILGDRLNDPFKVARNSRKDHIIVAIFPDEPGARHSDGIHFIVIHQLNERSSKINLISQEYTHFNPSSLVI